MQRIFSFDVILLRVKDLRGRKWRIGKDSIDSSPSFGRMSPLNKLTAIAIGKYQLLLQQLRKMGAYFFQRSCPSGQGPD